MITLGHGYIGDAIALSSGYMASAEPTVRPKKKTKRKGHNRKQIELPPPEPEHARLEREAQQTDLLLVIQNMEDKLVIASKQKKGEGEVDD